MPLTTTMGRLLLNDVLPASHQITGETSKKQLNTMMGQSMNHALLQGLRELGYEEAKNIAFEYRYGEGRRDRVRDHAVDLVRGKVDIIVSGGVQATRAAKNATRAVPIVKIGVGPDPVEAGLVESLAHPGGNLTGFTNLSLGITGKRLELLKERLALHIQDDLPTILTNPADLWQCDYCPVREFCESLNGGPVGKEAALALAQQAEVGEAVVV